MPTPQTPQTLKPGSPEWCEIVRDAQQALAEDLVLFAYDEIGEDAVDALRDHLSKGGICAPHPDPSEED